MSLNVVYLKCISMQMQRMTDAQFPNCSKIKNKFNQAMINEIKKSFSQSTYIYHQLTRFHKVHPIPIG